MNADLPCDSHFRPVHRSSCPVFYPPGSILGFALQNAPAPPTQNRPETRKTPRLTARPPSASLTLCPVRPQTNSPSPAQCPVHAAAQ